jgi:nicotinamidase-related amidase
MRTLYYIGLEPYNARYTLQLTEWNRRVFDRRGINVVYVPGETLDSSQKISVGQVLDAHGRSYFAMSQMMNLVKMMREGKVNSHDVIYFEDMFHPGFESLPYIINQISTSMRPRIYVRCLAQTIDPDDFVHVWNMDNWMRHYEKMVCSCVTAILASNEEMVAHMRIAGWDVPIYNISGLAFSIDEVLERVDNYLIPFHSRRMRVAFTSRWDREKQPHFFMDLIEAWHEQFPSKDVEFVICSGGDFTSNDESCIVRARKMEEEGKLIIYDNLPKNKYYEILNNSRVVFNCALQDWTSNTVSEADALGCNVLFPAYRSFPEIFANDYERMYIPWSIEDAITKLDNLLKKPHPNMGKISNWTNGTIDRICDIIEGKGEQWRRDINNYRKRLTEKKY